MKNLCFSCCLLLLAGNAFTQCTVNGANLVPNPSFELTTAFCNGTDNQIYVDQSPLQNWLGTDPLASAASTPDIARNDATVCGTPTNAANATCFTGTKRAGFFVYNTSFTAREYIQVALTTPLVAGTTYCFAMDVRSRYGAAGNLLMNTDGVGAYFRNSGPLNIQTMNGGAQFIGPGSTINATPQVQQPAGVVITNTCTTVTGNFVATGGESWVIIGNFRTDAGTTITGPSTTSYMLVDNVRLYPINPLPIELSSFSGNCNEGKPVISWTTESERNNNYFTLERSCDGSHFEEVTVVKGAGNSSQLLHYSATDETPCSGTVYYRLSQTDNDGTRTFFDLISVVCESGDTFMLYPNPAVSECILTGNNQFIRELQLYAVNGEVVRDYSDLLTDSKGPLTLDVSGMAKGVYFLRVISSSSGPVIRKLVIQ